MKKIRRLKIFHHGWYDKEELKAARSNTQEGGAKT